MFQKSDAILNRAVDALGGVATLRRAKGFSWTGTGPMTLSGLKGTATIVAYAQGTHFLRQELVLELEGTKLKGLTLLADNKGFRELLGKRTLLDKATLAEERRAAYLTLLPLTLLPLRERGYQREAQADGSLKITPPDGKPFTLFFAPETGLPHKLVATVPGLGGEDAVLQETTFSDYKPFEGIQKATRVSSTRNGQPFIEQVISEFTIIEQPDRRRFQF